MATQTTYYNLTKPAYEEKADIGVINDDLDAIDSAMKANADSATAAQNAAVIAQGLANNAQASADAKLGPNDSLNAENLEGTVPDECLPSYVDDVIDAYVVGSVPYSAGWLSKEDGGEPLTPAQGKIYIVLSEGEYENVTYRWSGTVYVSISNPIDIATEDEARAGTDNTKTMTPLRVKQAIDENAPTYDEALSSTSVNAVQNKALKAALDAKVDKAAYDAEVTKLEKADTDEATARAAADEAIWEEIRRIDRPVFDPETGRYQNVGQWMDSKREGLIYSVLIPKYSYSTTTACVKADANAGLTVTPSTASSAGQDDYQSHLAFMGWDVNGGADEDGSPYATAFQVLDSMFDRYGSNGNVWRATAPLYWRFLDEGNYYRLSISDTELDGFEIQPGGLLPDGTRREFMLYSKYAGGLYDGKYASVSGIPAKNRTVSHDSLISMCQNTLGKQYSGLSVAHQWYVNVMLLMKYANKSSQNVFTGCTGYTWQGYPSVSETGVSRVIVSNSAASSIEVGSAMQFGTHTSTSTDRNTGYNYDIFDGLTVESKTAYDSSNTAINFNTDKTFDSLTSYYMSTAPWPCGALDNVQGVDGTITAAGRTNSREPFLIQGIECAVGFYEIGSQVILNAASVDGSLVVERYTAWDSANDATSLTSNFEDSGFSYPTASSAGWLYTTDIVKAAGTLVPTGQGANTSTGTGDGFYQNVATSKGLRELLLWGYLTVWAFAGAWIGISDSGLGGTWWNLGSRLSCNGRTMKVE